MRFSLFARRVLFFAVILCALATVVALAQWNGARVGPANWKMGGGASPPAIGDFSATDFGKDFSGGGP